MTRLSPALLVFSVSTALAAPLAAQFHDHSYGGLVGISFAKAGGADVGGESKLVTGTAVGAFLTLGFARVLAFEPQILLVEKGLKSEEGGLSASVKLTYIQIPLLAKLRVPVGSGERFTGFAFAGPGLAYKVGCRLKLVQIETGNELVGGCDSDDESDSIRSFDASMIFGLGAEFGRYSVSLRYDMGLSRLDSSEENNDIKNRAIILLAGVKVRMNQ